MNFKLGDWPTDGWKKQTEANLTNGGVDVTIAIFCDFSPKTNVMMKSWQKLAVF
jgi:hypothetical protein